MESLYTKYRPQTFEQVVGQKHVVETLKRAVTEGRTSHAYLFCGPRGTGKTTMARLLAKALMCEKGAGQLPDGTCEQCRLIAAGEHPDVAELDAASRTGVDNVREEILSRVNYAPTMGRCKVYIIDEVHMLTPAAFNALLKTLEEPPEHVVFIMCTTDPQKILATILSRVQRFDFHSIANDEMLEHLARVCEQEGFTFDRQALELVVRHARGGMRDALTSLEQLSVFGNGNISVAAAQDFLGEVSGSVLGNVGQALASRDVPALFAEVERLVGTGCDLLQFSRELASHVRDLYVLAAAPGANAVAATADELAALKEEAAAFGSADRLSYVLTVLGDASNQMRTAVNQRLVLEVAFTKVARPESDVTLDSLAARVAELEGRLADLEANGVQVTAPAAAPTAPAAAPAASAPAPAASSQPVAQAPAPVSAPAPQPAAPAQAPAPRPAALQPAASAPRPAAPQPRPAQDEKASEPAYAPAKPAITNPSELQRAWKRVVDTLLRESPSRGSLVMNASAVSDDGEKLVISLPKGSRFAAKMLERADVREVVEGVVRVVFGRRQVLYTESSMAQTAIAASDRAARRAPAQRQPAAAQAPQAPAARPAAPDPSQSFAAPWEAPAAPQPPADDEPPADAYGAVDDGYAAAPPDFSAPQPQAPAASQPAVPQPAQAAPQPVPQPLSPQPAPERETPVYSAPPSDLAPEFADIVSMLGEVFDQPVNVSVEPAATPGDQDADPGLAYDGQGADEAPLDDADDFDPDAFNGEDPDDE